MEPGILQRAAQRSLQTRPPLHPPDEMLHVSTRHHTKQRLRQPRPPSQIITGETLVQSPLTFTSG